ncbi:tetratricopeptide repeat protein [Leptolyngbya ohadii]|uniref:tetratricopeptide repeat protein n=1 Tax=Leptolyngbya ohadii TaxID=1962290 RepID=UPI000B59F058|nr:tetratricopeptide repeat protein [Leptolyngbya ohadii]
MSTDASSPNPLFAIPLLNRAKDQYAKGQYEAAIASCNEALAFNPNLQTIYSYRGICYFELKNYDAALADQNRAIELQPDSAQVYCDRGLTYITLEQPQSAFADYNRAIELKPNLIEARVGRSAAQLQLKEYEKVIADCDYVLERRPELLDVYALRAAAYQGLNNVAEMLKDLNYSVNLQLITDRHDPKAWVSKSTLLSNSGDYSAALHHLDHSLQLDPTLAVAWKCRGIVNAALENYPAALEDLNHALQLDANYVDAYLNRAVVYLEMKLYQEAIQDCDRTLQLDDHSLAAYFLRSQSKFILGLHQEVIQDCDRALQLDVDSEFVLFYYIKGSALLFLGQYRSALNEFLEEFRLTPEPSSVQYYRIALVQYWLRMDDEAIANFDRAIELEPQSIVAYYYRGSLRLRMGDSPQTKEHQRSAALQDFQQARLLETTDAGQLFPDDEYAYYIRGVVHARMDQREDAIADLQQALNLCQTRFNHAFAPVVRNRLEQISI